MELPIDAISGVVVNRTTGDASSPSQEYFGDNLIFSVTLNFRVVCSPNFYDQDCNTFCVARNDTSGRFTCNEDDGSIVCFEGYQNENTNCTECIPAENCCKICACICCYIVHHELYSKCVCLFQISCSCCWWFL